MTEDEAMADILKNELENLPFLYDNERVLQIARLNEPGKENMKKFLHCLI